MSYPDVIASGDEQVDAYRAHLAGKLRSLAARIDGDPSLSSVGYMVDSVLDELHSLKDSLAKADELKATNR